MDILLVDDKDERHLALGESIQKLFPGATITHVWTLDTACLYAARGFWDIVYLDHDTPEGSFFPVAVICALNSGVKEVRIHSDNGVAAGRMALVIQDIRTMKVSRVDSVSGV